MCPFNNTKLCRTVTVRQPEDHKRISEQVLTLCQMVISYCWPTSCHPGEGLSVNLFLHHTYDSSTTSFVLGNCNFPNGTSNGSLHSSYIEWTTGHVSPGEPHSALLLISAENEIEYMGTTHRLEFLW